MPPATLSRRSILGGVLPSWPRFRIFAKLVRLFPMWECTYLIGFPGDVGLAPVVLRMYTNGSMDARWHGKRLVCEKDTHGWVTFSGHSWKLRVKRPRPCEILVSSGYYLKPLETGMPNFNDLPHAHD